MNKYRVIYYLCIIAFIANVSMMIGTLMGWFHILDSNYFFWTSLILSFVFERVEKKVKERKVKENKVNKNTGAKEKIDLSYFSYDEKLNEAFLEYAKMREKIKKPISTQHTVDLLVKKLKELSTVNGHMDNDRAIAVLDQSIMNNWQDLYGLKSNNNSSRSFNNHNQGGGIDWDKV